MNVIAAEILIVLLLIAANGLFAMAEISIVSVCKTRLRKLTEQGDARARAALELSEEPNRFLSTVQVGITLIGILAGAFSGATIAKVIAGALQSIPVLAPYAEAIGIGVVVLGLTFLSVVLGELVPKRLALNNPLGVALALARPMRRLSLITHPVVRVLGATTDEVLHLFGFRARPEPPVTEEEVRTLVEQGHHAGVFFKTEKEMVEQALVLDTKCVGDLMTQRAQIIWLNAADANEVNWRKTIDSGHSYFPVYENNRDQVLGMVSVKVLWAHLSLAQPFHLRDVLTEPLFVPASMTALKLLETFKQSRKHLALVPDEFGTVQGLVTLVDVFEEIVGDIPSFDQPPQPRIVLRDDGSWLVDALLKLDELKPLLGVTLLPGEENESYETLGGFILHQMQRIPREGDHFEWGGFRFEVADVDRHRLDKILIHRPKPMEPAAAVPDGPRAP
ncbi:hemolysin family protein [Prosthecobacter sp.]|uniref:hemolysin family protein n=1 Tax=Prosthecobacter sp. TaxID=1965333 RepID=UPI0024898024|nr:hemolysin family protein [Prosthecobacter sp.]MDI1313711.1 hemolysin family protein [Prosthecobacter sp.]